ncbi:class I SAM-dependent methyltransferase [Rubrobacter indicoceani]|uniref:class I SAM-dependent methyltransferase n=1 Tax=Rubrobacter indicoceani TaxID=2051957 RepID=UPI000E5BA5D3|nr:class I SAM-dependent methyltransferase [Rubrobacter indicoceani]
MTQGNTTGTEAFDRGRSEAFAERMISVLNEGSLALMTSIGHRTGLFDTISGMPPATSEGIAAAANLNERYVREWLGAMVVGRIVEHDPDKDRYSLPPEHAACLTRAAAPENIAAFCQYVPLLGAVEDEIVARFHGGGGVPYSSYPRFHAVMAEDSAQTVGAALHEHILPLVPGLAERLEAGIDVLDVGCGSGRAMNALARSYPNSRFSGYDLSEEAVGRAREQSEKDGLANTRFIVLDAATLDEAEAYSLVTTFDAVHDQARPDIVLAAVNRALKPDGVYLMQDIAAHSHLHGNLDHPLGPFLYTVSTMHCMPVSLYGEGGLGLGTMWGEEKATEMLGEAGFRNVEVHRLEHDPQNSYYIARK